MGNGHPQKKLEKVMNFQVLVASWYLYKNHGLPEVDLPSLHQPARPASALQAVRAFLMANITLTESSKAGSPVAKIKVYYVFTFHNFSLLGYYLLSMLTLIVFGEGGYFCHARQNFEKKCHCSHNNKTNFPI